MSQKDSNGSRLATQTTTYRPKWKLDHNMLWYSITGPAAVTFVTDNG